MLTYRSLGGNKLISSLASIYAKVSMNQGDQAHQGLLTSSKALSTSISSSDFVLSSSRYRSGIIRCSPGILVSQHEIVVLIEGSDQAVTDHQACSGDIFVP